MGFFLLFFLSNLFGQASDFDQLECLVRAKQGLISSVKTNQPKFYENDVPVIKYAEVYCGCLQQRLQGQDLKSKVPAICKKEAALEFNKALETMAKETPKKEISRRTIVSACLPEMMKNFAEKLEATSLKILSDNNKIKTLERASLMICECISSFNADFAFKGLEEKKELSKEEMLKIQKALAAFKKSKEGKQQISQCLHHGHLLIPVLHLTPYDKMPVFLAECSPLVTNFTILSLGLGKNQELAQKYAKNFCECSHAKLKAQETREAVARLCHKASSESMEQSLQPEDKQASYKETFRKTFKAACLEKMTKTIQEKIEESKLKELSPEVKSRFASLALASTCGCVAKHETENSFWAISNALILSPEEEKRLNYNRKKYASSPENKKNNEACIDEGFKASQTQLVEELKEQK